MTGDDDNDVNGNSAMGDEVNEDGDGAMGDDNNNDDDNGDDDDDGDGDSAMGSGATGYDDDDDDDTGERGRRKMVWRQLAAAWNDGVGGDGARALLGQ